MLRDFERSVEDMAFWLLVIHHISHFSINLEMGSFDLSTVPAYKTLGQQRSIKTQRFTGKSAIGPVGKNLCQAVKLSSVCKFKLLSINTISICKLKVYFTIEKYL